MSLTTKNSKVTETLVASEFRFQALSIESEMLGSFYRKVDVTVSAFDGIQFFCIGLRQS